MQLQEQEPLINGLQLQWTLDREEEWWREAYMDILNGEISAVRYTIVQNVTGEYPKVWRIFERI